MPRHRLSRADQRPLSGEHPAQGHRLIHVTLLRRSGVRIDVVDIVQFNARIPDGPCHGRHAAHVARFRDTAAVAREPVARHLRQNPRPARPGVVVVL